MYTVSVDTCFSAVHRLRLPDGSLEPLNGHDWQVCATFRCRELDGAGMVVDFEAARDGLRQAVADLHHSNLNEHPAFAGRNPTAEAVARCVFDRLRQQGLALLWRVEVTEAPGCIAGYEGEPV